MIKRSGIAEVAKRAFSQRSQREWENRPSSPKAEQKVEPRDGASVRAHLRHIQRVSAATQPLASGQRERLAVCVRASCAAGRWMRPKMNIRHASSAGILAHSSIEMPPMDGSRTELAVPAIARTAR